MHFGNDGFGTKKMQIKQPQILLSQNSLFYFCYALFLLHSGNKKRLLASTFWRKQWIDLIFFLNIALTIVLNHGQNDEK